MRGGSFAKGGLVRAEGGRIYRYVESDFRYADGQNGGKMQLVTSYPREGVYSI